jgi:hypothetical protein
MEGTPERMRPPAHTYRIPPRPVPQEIQDVEADVPHHQNRPVMVVHGPEIFDSGEASWLIDRICPSRTIVAGVMARTAA